MNKQRIIDLMHNPNLIEGYELPILREMVDRYPYSSTMRILYTRGLKQIEDIRTESELKTTAIHAPDRKQLHFLVTSMESVQKELVNDENTSSHDSQISDDSVVKEEIKANSADVIENVEQEESTILSDKTTKDNVEIQLEKQYLTKAIESSIKLDVTGGNSLPTREDLAALKSPAKKPETPTIKFGKPSSFSDFLDGEVGGREENIQQLSGISSKQKTFFDPAKMAQDSLIDRQDFMTETLADIYLRQGYYEKAIRAFEHLSLKYPEKSTYFADRIEKIKKALA